ncbi:hypothetical protein SASPL_136826 [Salvia splendens]|uniref:Leucine-rich repeat-containing N-terminal plant-type domain-containing protein n=1 Tax=Salvia splendens TaxID=180675 RepID=A0A8X8ZH30_SALSN|nr:hypothetical protein SASPL_136826 [Salvia splendens]
MEMLLKNMTWIRELYLDGVFLSNYERRKWSHIVSSYLPNLTGLSLVWCSLSGPLARSFSHLNSLYVLRLDSNDLSAADLDLFANFSGLTTLSLFNSGLKGSFPSVIFQIPTLEYLDLSQNELLSGSIPPFTQNGSLKLLKLTGTNFSGLIPSSIDNLKGLSEINLGGCKFTWPIPSTFANLTELDLTILDLSSNHLEGHIRWSGKAWGATQQAMLKWNQTDDCCEWEGVGCDAAGHVVILQLDNEGISGGVEDSSSLVSLEKLKLANNSLKGTIPTLNHSSLIELDLSSNQLKGPISNSFLNLPSLEVLSLSHNLFNDTFQLENIHRLHNLTTLNLSHNNFSLDANSNLSRFSHLKKLSLSSCNLHKIPDFLKQSNLNFLDLSDNQITGEIPSWIWEMGNGGLYHLNLSYNLLFDLQKPYHIPDFLAELDLHSNQLHGELPLLPQGASYIDLSSNKFDKPIPLTFVSSNTFMMFLSIANNSISGSIPTSFCGSESLRILDLSLNNLSGSIPPCIAEWMSSLEVLNLRRNNISGDIPDKFSTSCRLKFLDVNNNNLGGNFPKTLGNCNSLEMVNVEHNKIEGSFPCMLASRLKVLILRSNLFVGEVRCGRDWPNLQAIDVSSNHFRGNLQQVSFSSWKKMVLGSKKYKRVLPPDFTYLDLNQGSLSRLLEEYTYVDFSSNNFDGEIPEAIGDLKTLTVLNLSHNSLTGAIPKSFGNMTNLEALDVSVNQLTRTIPMELEQLTFLSILKEHIRPADAEQQNIRIEGCVAASAPVDLRRLIEEMHGQVIFRSSFGGRYIGTENGKKFMRLVRVFMRLVGEIHIGDFIPWLGWIGRVNGFDKRLDTTAEELDQGLESVIQDRQRLGKGNGKGKEEEEEDFLDILLQIYNQDASTDPDSIKPLLLLLRHPRVMEKLQSEVRGVVKQKQHITQDDLEKMGYMKAVIKENMRLLSPRISSKDVHIKGYDVAAGTMAMVNTWAIGRELVSWDEPDKFMPERFLNSSIDFKGQDFDLVPFGPIRSLFL